MHFVLQFLINFVSWVSFSRYFYPKVVDSMLAVRVFSFGESQQISHARPPEMRDVTRSCVIWKCVLHWKDVDGLFVPKLNICPVERKLVRADKHHQLGSACDGASETC
jgi:hypothetical protein